MSNSIGESRGVNSGHMSPLGAIGGNAQAEGGIGTLLPQTKRWLEATKISGAGKPSWFYIKQVDILIRQLITDNNWQYLDALWILATEQQAHARINVVNPLGLTLVESNPSNYSAFWTKNIGYGGNGSNTWIDTKFNPSVGINNFTLNNACFGCFYHTVGTSLNGIEMGLGNLVCYLQGQFESGFGQMNINGAAGGDSFVNFPVTNGVPSCLSVVRRASNSQAVYKNGVSDVTSAIASVSIPNATFSLLRCNTNSFVSVDTISLAWIGSSSINQLTFYNALNSFKKIIGF